MTTSQTHSFVPMNIEATVQFGNSFDVGGKKIKQAKILGKRTGGFVDVYIVRDGDTVGIATLQATDDEGELCNFYYCTSAFPISVRFPAEFIAKHFGIPVEVLA